MSTYSPARARARLQARNRPGARRRQLTLEQGGQWIASAFQSGVKAGLVDSELDGPSSPNSRQTIVRERQACLPFAFNERSVVRSDVPLVTTTDRESTSTVQSNESLGSNPSTVATDCGTVVLSESDTGEARIALDSKVLAMGRTKRPRPTRGIYEGLSGGRKRDLIVKYTRLHGSISRPMSGTRGPWDTETEARAIRLISGNRHSVRANGRVRFAVDSRDGTRPYEVVADSGGWTCTCRNWVDRRTPCKHIIATVIWLDPNRIPAGEVANGPVRPTYSQPDWGAYDRGQQLEHQLFDRYLWDLLGDVPQMPWTGGKRGRPVVPLRTQIWMSTRKVHLNQSMRRGRGLLVALNSDGKGFLPEVPNYSVPSRFFNRPQAPAILLDLIERSGLVVKDIEDAGTLAIDSTGFSTSTMGAYLTEKYHPERRHRFVKAHLAVGVKSHVVLAVRLTDEHGADCPQFAPLLRRVAEIGHTPARVVADKAYLSRENFAVAAALGIDPFIPFKSNSRGLSKNSPMWNRKYHEIQLRRDYFEDAYHKRSNVESVNSAIKRMLGEPLLSKNEFARLNELLAKILAYNIARVIRLAHLLGLEPGATAFIPKTPTAPESTEAAA